MKKASEVFKSIRFAKTEPRDKPHSSTDEEGHYTVGEKEYNQQLKHVKKMAMQEAKEKLKREKPADIFHPGPAANEIYVMKQIEKERKEKLKKEEVELDEASSAALRMQKALQKAKEQREREQRAGEALLKPKPQPPVQKEEAESEERYCPKCNKMEKRSECAYGPSYWDKYAERMNEEVKDSYDEGEYDREGDMAKSDLRSIIDNAKRLHDMIDDADNLPEWVQSKITIAEDYISTVANYMTSEVNEEIQYIEEKNAPTNPGLWSRAKALARSKFDVYPSAYANGWAAKWYKSKGGGWKTVSEEIEYIEEMPGANMDTRAVHAHLKKKGWALTRSSGGHDVYTHPEAEHHIAVPRHRQLKAPLVKGILKQSIVREDTEQLHELSDKKLIGYLEKVHADSMKNKMDPTKRSPEKSNKSVMGFSRAMNKLEARPQVKEDIEIDDDIIENAIAFLNEGRPSQRHPLEGHEYHKKTNAELEYIAKDAHKAAEAMKGHNTQAENKYRDQANDSATVRYYRQKHGMADWYKKKYGHVNEEVEQIDEISSELAKSYLAKRTATHKPDLNTPETNKYSAKIAQGKAGAAARMYGYGHDKNAVNKVTGRFDYRKRVGTTQVFSKEEIEITEGKMKQLHPDSELPDAEPIKRPDIPFTPDKPKKASAVAGKYGSGYSTAKHLAKQAMKKQSENLKKPRIQEEKDKEDSKKAKIVRDVVKNGKTKTTKDTFEANPELTSEIIKT